MSRLFLAVNFHYIGPRDRYPHPGIHGVSAEEFAAQLDALGRHFDLVGLADIRRAAANDRPLPERAAVITFDDGLREQFEVAVPILASKKVPFICFVGGLPLLEGKALTTHKLHYLRANTEPGEFLERLAETAAGLGIALEVERAAREIPAFLLPYDEPQSRLIKYCLNYLVTPRQSARLVERLFAEAFEEAAFCSRFYLSREQARSLHADHQALGYHGLSHRPIALLGADEARREVCEGKRRLEELLGCPLAAMSYPFGGPQAVSWREEELAREAGLEFCFTMEKCFNRDPALGPHLLARVNNNEAVGHPQAAFVIDPDSREVAITDPVRMSLFRSRYYQER